MERAENTVYVLSLSYGKDSLACIEACRQLGYPIDRIVHAEVWATDDIPADLPPMVEFKAKADKIIKDRYGIEVEHVCATTTPDKKFGGGGLRTDRPTRTSSIPDTEAASDTAECTASRIFAEDGASGSNTAAKLTYEDMFYRPIKQHRKATQEKICGGGTRTSSTTASRCNIARGATHTSSSRRYGFPFGSFVGGWCHQLKMDALRLCNKTSPVVQRNAQREYPRQNKAGFRMSAAPAPK